MTQSVRRVLLRRFPIEAMCGSRVIGDGICSRFIQIWGQVYIEPAFPLRYNETKSFLEDGS